VDKTNENVLFFELSRRRRRSKEIGAQVREKMKGS